MLPFKTKKLAKADNKDGVTGTQFMLQLKTKNMMKYRKLCSNHWIPGSEEEIPRYGKQTESAYKCPITAWRDSPGHPAGMENPHKARWSL